VANAEKLKETTWGTILGAVVVVSVILMTTLLWLFWPYPSVTTKGTAILTNLDKRGYYETNDVVRWVTPQVCQPSGVTDVVVFAVLDFKNDTGGVASSETTVVARTFDVQGFPECVDNNPTSAYISGNLPTGTYRFVVEACVRNPSPRPKCDTFDGPASVKIVRIAGNEKDAPPA
jgi:hypothetical protein